jgi:guanylate kinase
MKKNLLVIASPSGGGKSTIAKHVLNKYPNVKFSISATTRQMRPGETQGKEYYFLTKDEFNQKIQNDELLEYEEIFGNIYGTLKSEVIRLTSQNLVPLFDVDVKGAMNIKNIYPENTLLLFIEPPSQKVAEERLRNRKSETEEQIQTRIKRYQLEISMKDEFDFCVINDDLQRAISEVEIIIEREIAL